LSNPPLSNNPSTQVLTMIETGPCHNPSYRWRVQPLAPQVVRGRTEWGGTKAILSRGCVPSWLTRKETPGPLLNIFLTIEWNKATQNLVIKLLRKKLSTSHHSHANFIGEDLQGQNLAVAGLESRESFSPDAIMWGPGVTAWCVVARRPPLWRTCRYERNTPSSKRSAKHEVRLDKGLHVQSNVCMYIRYK